MKWALCILTGTLAKKRVKNSHQKSMGHIGITYYLLRLEIVVAYCVQCAWYAEVVHEP